MSRPNIIREMTQEEFEWWTNQYLAKPLERPWAVVGRLGKSIAVVHPDFPSVHFVLASANDEDTAARIVEEHNAMLAKGGSK